MSEQLFNQIAKHYERGNVVISFGLSYYWNRQLVAALHQSHSLLDLCAGQGQVAFHFLKKNPHSNAHLVDFSKEMLLLAKERGRSFKKERFQTELADVENLPLNANSFDALSCAYGIRNVKNPLRCFQEAYRVLQEGGRFAILELTKPKNSLLQKLHRFYLKRGLPLFGKLLFHDRAPYDYLANSVLAFDEKKIVIMLKEANFSEIRIRPLTFGTATLITAIKSP